jgi:hypothetical protein
MWRVYHRIRSSRNFFRSVILIAYSRLEHTARVHCRRMYSSTCASLVGHGHRMIFGVRIGMGYFSKINGSRLRLRSRFQASLRQFLLGNLAVSRRPAPEHKSERSDIRNQKSKRTATIPPEDRRPYTQGPKPSNSPAGTQLPLRTPKIPARFAGYTQMISLKTPRFV